MMVVRVLAPYWVGLGKSILDDPDLAALHDDPEFEAIVEELRRRNEDGTPAKVE